MVTSKVGLCVFGLRVFGLRFTVFTVDLCETCYWVHHFHYHRIRQEHDTLARLPPATFSLSSSLATVCTYLP